MFIIESIKVRNFRMLADAHVDCQPGLNVIAGANREGKSTLLRAVQTVLFCKHDMGGKRAKALSSFVKSSSLSAKVEIRFRLGGKVYDLSKVFCQNQGAILNANGKFYRDGEAEDELEKLFKFEFSKGIAKNHGPASLLWLEHGMASKPVEVSKDNHNLLLAAIEEGMDQLSGGKRGEAFLEETKRRGLNSGWTDTWKKTKELKEREAGIEDRISELGKTIREKKDDLKKRDEYREKIAELRGTLTNVQIGLQKKRDDLRERDSAYKAAEKKSQESSYYLFAKEI